ncbi:hypothetical protein MX009_09455 [Streptococcus uberis]|uniref:hypothetical protein n=1 Tax=Streptococcus uberis TaxID=1349 RepID=UPI001FF462B9|nr:hypothetical protein [Streptococcus uberis]MCK1193710.1 hypothetical protein [Streptococcus uberis]MCK1195452.1 hypothetical protein [Streptococcus uberis]MCK1197304.1 hypothetical protein [Streptococcus uberis]MCK1221249.1 hypothetical protein [Streptococcus uberis]MCK1230568.1 hypothetical protein [Streptococcus uberis]
MTSLLKKLFVTGLVACSIGAATTSVSYADEKPTIDEIETANLVVIIMQLAVKS